MNYIRTIGGHGCCKRALQDVNEQEATIFPPGLPALFGVLFTIGAVSASRPSTASLTRRCARNYLLHPKPMLKIAQLSISPFESAKSRSLCGEGIRKTKLFILCVYAL